jgi:hypothetical protein
VDPGVSGSSALLFPGDLPRFSVHLVLQLTQQQPTLGERGKVSTRVQPAPFPQLIAAATLPVAAVPTFFIVLAMPVRNLLFGIKQVGCDVVLGTGLFGYFYQYTASMRPCLAPISTVPGVPHAKNHCALWRGRY